MQQLYISGREHSHERIADYLGRPDSKAVQKKSLTEVRFEEVIGQAKVFGVDLERTGKLTGPSHGLPIVLRIT